MQVGVADSVECNGVDVFQYDVLLSQYLYNFKFLLAKLRIIFVSLHLERDIFYETNEKAILEGVLSRHVAVGLGTSGVPRGGWSGDGGKG